MSPPIPRSTPTGSAPARRAATALRDDARARARRSPSACVETGTRGEGGDRTLRDRRGAPRTRSSPSSTRCTPTGARFTAVSEERGEVDFGGDGAAAWSIDPIDGSLNAKRGLPHYALSIAVADGPDDGRRRVRLRARLRAATRSGSRWRGGGAHARRRAARPDAGRAPRRATASSRSLGVESADPRWVRAVRRRAGRGRATGCARSATIAVVAVPGRGRRLRRDGHR